MFALLLAAALAPTDSGDLDEFSEPPGPCSVEWSSPKDYPMFVRMTEPMLLRRCSDLAAVLEYEGPAESIHIHVSGEHLEFRVHISISDGDSQLYESTPTEICECGSNELTTLAMQQVVAALEELRKPKSETEIETGPKEPPPGETEPEPEPEPPKHTTRWVGVGLGVAGLASVSAGIPLHLYEDRSEGTDPVGENVKRKSRALTVPLMVAGSAAIVTGVTLIIYDAVTTKKKKKNNNENGRRTAVTPSISPSWAGLSVHGRF